MLTGAGSGANGASTVSAADGGAIVVTGSRIARQQVEGLAPVTILSSADIDKNGFRSVFDALTTLTQNTGEDFGSTFSRPPISLTCAGSGPIAAWC